MQTGHPERQHYIPNFYLRRFSHKKKVRAYNRVTWMVLASNTINLCVESRFYDFLRPDGSIATIGEDLLKQIESQAGPALEALSASRFPVRAGDRRVISLFAASLITRTREFWDLQSTVSDSLRSALLDDGLSEPEADRVRVSSAATDLTQEDRVGMMFSISEKFAEALNQKTWVLGRSPRGGIVTSDHPVAHYQWKPDPLIGVGLMNADEIHFPFDPRNVLIFARPEVVPSDRVLLLTEQNVLFTNSLMAGMSYELTFQHPGEPRLSPELTPVGPRPLLGTDSAPTYSRRHTGINKS